MNRRPRNERAVMITRHNFERRADGARTQSCSRRFERLPFSLSSSCVFPSSFWHKTGIPILEIDARERHDFVTVDDIRSISRAT
jgi:hypothetical protein